MTRLSISLAVGLTAVLAPTIALAQNPGDCLPPNNLTLQPPNGEEVPTFQAGTTSGVFATFHFERTSAGVPVPAAVDVCVTSDPPDPNAICGSPAGAQGAEYTPPNGVRHLDVIDVRACFGLNCDPSRCTARSVQYSLDPEVGENEPYLIGCGLLPLQENEGKNHGVYVAICGCPSEETCVPSGVSFRIEYLYLDEVDRCQRGEIVREVACDETIEITILPPVCSRDLPEPWQEDPARTKIFATSLIGTSACSPRACWFAPLQNLDPRIQPSTVMNVPGLEYAEPGDPPCQTLGE